ncbi:DOPA-like domain-containing protein [Pisolithus orientalis]|uniref:DOPA-like domain-containing protein n=1 Tax=Pisolithus orientalis TaxID=936130 RepID=UPI00222453EB|nr:DOPA-like domain-containing protein [Pisolithus orientalis]KAI6009592.1 DOPA-like domain-containing protein [Pisolithus orientalis]
MAPQSDLEDVVNLEINTFIDIYFHQNNAEEHAAALELRDAVLRLRRDGAFVAVPLFRVNTYPMGPHPVGSYEIWVPSTSFAPVFSYLCQNRGKLSILIHPLTKEEVRLDHQFRNAWMGAPFPLDLSVLPDMVPEVPLQYPSLRLGYSAPGPDFTLEERRRIGANVERILEGEKEAARAPPRESN